MNYAKHYENLMKRARCRLLEGYVEKHHVVPRCMGGLDEVGNLVQLTAEEHYVAHQLLCKIYPDNKSLAYAVVAMTAANEFSQSRTTNKLFGWLRKKFSAAQKGRPKSAQERANIAEAGRNRAPRIFSEEARANMAQARRKTWEERREKGEAKLIGEKTRATRIANGSYQHTEESKAKLSAAGKGREPPNKGKKALEETRRKQSLVRIGKEPWNKGVSSPKVSVKMLPEEVSAIRKAASIKMWEERRKTGKNLDVGLKASITRRANGSYVMPQERKDRIREALKGNNNRVKNRVETSN